MSYLRTTLIYLTVYFVSLVIFWVTMRCFRTDEKLSIVYKVMLKLFIFCFVPIVRDLLLVLYWLYYISSLDSLYSMITLSKINSKELFQKKMIKYLEIKGWIPIYYKEVFMRKNKTIAIPNFLDSNFDNTIIEILSFSFIGGFKPANMTIKEIERLSID